MAKNDTAQLLQSLKEVTDKYLKLAKIAGNPNPKKEREIATALQILAQNQKEEKTKVIFRVHQGELLALFPALAGGIGKPWECTCYAHIGQHGSADVSIMRTSRPATKAEYQNLARELRQIGYRLDIKTRTSKADLKARRDQLKLT